MVRHWLWGPYSPFGFVVAALVILADQGSKLWLLHVYDIAERTKNGPIEPFPYFQLHMVWNPGVSLGLMPQDTTMGRIGLLLFALVVSVALVIWLARATSTLTTLSLGLILGGAIGNAIDRALYGKVADFFYIDIRWIDIWPIKYMFDYVFNVADVAIVVGVIGLLYESLFGGHKKAGNPSKM
jgi:signal peptidase II